MTPEKTLSERLWGRAGSRPRCMKSCANLASMMALSPAMIRRAVAELPIG